MGFQVYSFDLFDTLITRSVAHPTDLFDVMDNESIRLKAGSFRQRRIQAEERARTKSPSREVTLHEIYQDFCTADNQCPRLGLEELVAREISAELLVLKLVETNAALLDSLVKQGKKVVLISDTYFESNVLHRFFRELGRNDWARLPLFASCERRASKRMGTLYRVAIEELGVPASGWLHTGNDFVADQQMAVNAGMQCRPFQDGNLTRYESILAKEGLQSSLLAGEMRAHRLNLRPKLKIRNRTMRSIGFQVAGPFLMSFVDWVLEQAKQQEVQHLVFPSRDGWILKKIADHVIQAKKLSIRTTYFFCSRKTLLRPFVDLDALETSQWLFDLHDGFDFQLPFVRLGFSHELAEKLGIAFQAFCEDDPHECPKRLRAFLVQAELLDQAKEILQEARKSVLGYIASIDWESTSMGYVDVGWSGRTYQAFKQLVSESQVAKSVRGFFVGLSSSDAAPDVSTFLFGPERSKKTAPFEFCTTLMEVLCSAPHGSVLGYRESHGRTRPVLEAGWAKEYRRSGLGDLQRGLLEFMALPQALSGLPRSDGYALLIECAKAFVSEPTPEEALAMSQVNFASGTDGSTFVPLCRSFTLLEYFPYEWCRKPLHLSPSQWLAGSIAMTPSHVRRVSRYASKLKRYLISAFCGVRCACLYI